MLFSCFATTVRGLEELLAKELTDLGAAELNLVNAGLEFRANLQNIMQMNLYSRLASRIMIQLGYSGYRYEDDIYRLAKKIKWDNWFHSGNTIKVSTNAIASPLKSLDFITLRIKDAICDYFVDKVDARPSVDKIKPDIRIYTFLTKDAATIYLDTSGEALFKRGYRKSKLEAPIRENLAFGLIKLSGWTPEQTFFDPMCGSGTLLIEAITYGLNIAPGLNRNFAFENFINFVPETWQSIKSAAKSAINYDKRLRIFANDINCAAIEIAKENLKSGDLRQYVTFSCDDFLTKHAPDSGGVIVTNPPYGLRIDEQDRLAKLYPQIGNHLKKNYAGWNCYFLSADLRLAKLIKLKPSRKIPICNGALECRLFEFKMVKGQFI